jgi:hypothetical protein
MNQYIGKALRRLGTALWILHPILFFFYSIFSLMAANQSIPLRAVTRSLAIGFFLILLILYLSQIWGNGERAALIISGAIILFFSYGHLINLIETYIGKPFDKAGEWALFAPGLIAAALWIYFVRKRLRHVYVFTQYFLVVSLLVNLFPLLQRLQAAKSEGIAQAQFLAYQNEMKAELDLREVWGEEDMTVEVPQRDIYYIVLDAYARADVLEDLYGYDNTEFIRFLETRGFYVAGESNANYISTELSLASSLNMSHLSGLPDVFDSQGGVDANTVKSIAVNLISSNILQGYFHDRGYTVISIESGYAATALGDADIYLQSTNVDRGSLWRVGFETMLLDSSLGRLLMRILPNSASTLDWLFDLHRERILYTFDHLTDFAQDDRPTFVYAHIISPHTPYVFGPNGERLEHQDPFTLLDTNPGNPENIKYYRDQVHYLNSLIMEVIDEIFQKSTTEPIIFLQADHGSKVYKETQPAAEIQCRLHLPILNAYYFPDVDAQTRLYQTISPVNSFRILLNEYFHEELELLHDGSYELGDDEGKLKFIDYENAVAACP